MKATHKGNCQWCGRLHKISEFGLVAKHGYKVHQFEGFIGTCGGSGCKPLQTSCEEVVKSVAYTDKIITHIEERKNQVISGNRLPDYRHYERGLGYRWVKITEVIDRRTLKYSGGIIDLSRNAGLPYGDVNEFVNYLCNRHVADMEKNIMELTGYKNSQQKIVDNWKQSDLLPI